MHGDETSKVVDPQATSLQLGSLFLSLLAYPASLTDREKFAGALVHASVDMMVREAATFGEAPENLRLIAKLADRAEVDRLIKKGVSVISNQRLIAAEMARREYVANLEDSLSIPRPPSIPTHASDVIIAKVSNDLDDTRRLKDGRGRKAPGGTPDCNKGNILDRRWSPSLPVLHMAIAMDSLIRQLALDGLNFGDILFDVSICAWLIKQSEIHRPVVAEIFGIRPEMQKSIFFNEVISNKV